MPGRPSPARRFYSRSFTSNTTAFVIAQVFVAGLLLGWMRWATGSTLLTMLLHALINIEGMLETTLLYR